MLLERAKRKMFSRAALLSYPFRFWSRKGRLNHPTCLTPMLQQKPGKHSLVTQPLGRTESPHNHSCWCAIPRSPEPDRPRAGALRDKPGLSSLILVLIYCLFPSCSWKQIGQHSSCNGLSWSFTALEKPQHHLSVFYMLCSELLKISKAVWSKTQWSWLEQTSECFGFHFIEINFLASLFWFISLVKCQIHLHIFLERCFKKLPSPSLETLRKALISEQELAACSDGSFPAQDLSFRDKGLKTRWLSV